MEAKRHEGGHEAWAMEAGPSGTSSPSPADTQRSSGQSLASSILTPFSRHIGRNRACASCRDRKLKCDGARPICGQCARAWNMRRRSLKGKGLTDEEMRDMEKPCVYLDVSSGSAASPRRSTGGAEKRKRGARDSQASVDAADHAGETPLQKAERERDRLANELAELKSRLGFSGAMGAGSLGTAERQKHDRAGAADTPQVQSFQPNSDELSIAEVLAHTMRSSSGGNADDFQANLGVDDEKTRASISEALAGSKEFTSIVEGWAQRAANASTSAQSQQHGGTSGLGGSGDAAFVSSNDTGAQSAMPIDPLLLGGQIEQSPIQHSNGAAHSTDQDSLLQLILGGWPTDFPAPAVVDTLLNVFFDEFSFARLLFQKARMFEQVAKGPNSRDFPHPAVMHAIFALSYIARRDLDPFAVSLTSPPATQSQQNEQHRNESEGRIVGEDVLDAHLRHLHTNGPTFADPAYQAGQREGVIIALQSRYDRDRAKLGSAGYHSERAQYHITIGSWEGGDLMSLAQAAFLLTTKRYGCGELFDAWMTASVSSRLAVALAINRSHPRSRNNEATSGNGAYNNTEPIDVVRFAMTGPPTDWREEEERRRLMFLILATDRFACVSTLWANSLDDADVTVELPLLSNADFFKGDVEPSANAVRQTLQSPDLFSKNHIDGFNTMLKGSILSGRIAAALSRLPSFATEADLRSSRWFDRYDSIISSFIMSLPFRALDLDESGQMDPFRFITYAICHTNALLLHGPLLRLSQHSKSMCEAACGAMLDLLRILIATGMPYSRLPPVLIVCLSMTGRILVRRLQIVDSKSGEKDQAEVSTSSRAQTNTTTREQIDFDVVRHDGPIGWSFHPKTATGGRDATVSEENATAKKASKSIYMGEPRSEEEEKLRTEIDLVYTYLSKVGQTWAMATRQAQGLAQMLGIPTSESIDAVHEGLFSAKTMGKDIGFT